METPDQQQGTDYSGVVIGVVLLPVFLIFRHFGRVDLALSACIILGMIMLAIRMRWDLRSRVWFWATIVFVLLLHVPLLLLVPFPHIMVNRITLLPIGLADFLITWGAVRFVEKFIVKAAPSD
jgi:hypothetical protein